MPVLLFGIGAFALFAGLVMVGFGIPINEFSFGNTLISAGTTAAVGGLIIISLGIVAGQLRRVAEALAVQSPVPFGQPTEVFENSAERTVPVQGRVPFPSRPKAEPLADEPAPLPASALADEDEHFAPALRNPDEPPVAIEDEISLSPRQPQAPAGVDLGGFTRTPSFGGQSREPLAGMRSPPAPASPLSPSTPLTSSAPPTPSTLSPMTPSAPPRNFDAMWPAEPKPSKNFGVGEPKADSKINTPVRDTQPAAPKHGEPDSPKPRAVAILKSGVVDGMGYTLYVDGSIEAELPQGTLRFASINELRSHLENNS